MASVTGIGNMLINAIEIDNRSVKIEKYEQENLEFLDKTYNNLPYLNKIGTRNIYNYKIYNLASIELSVFYQLYSDLSSLNGQIITFTPHDDNATNFLCYLEVYLDRYSEYPVQYIDLKLSSVEVV